MSIIVLSSDSYCRCEEIASRVAQELGYECLGPEIEASAAATFSIPEDKMRQALSFSASPMLRLSGSREKYLAFFQAALVSALAGGSNVIYFGKLGHMLVAGVSHILKVKLTADLPDRVTRCAQAENLSEAKARDLVQKGEEQRRAWFLNVFEVDGSDPSAFDLVINLSQLGVDGVCRIIVETAREVRFQPVTYSRNTIRDHDLACRVRAELIGDYRDIEVTARDGEITLSSKALRKGKAARIAAVRERLLKSDGVTYVAFE